MDDFDKMTKKELKELARLHESAINRLSEDRELFKTLLKRVVSDLECAECQLYCE